MSTPEIPKEQEVVNIRVRPEVEFPKDPEKRFEAVFGAIGNSEAKCLTLLCLSQSPQTANELHQRFLAASGRVWQTDKRIQAGYCLATLIPIGLVVEADTLYFGATEYVTGFRLTEAGQKFGQPIAAFLLEKSARLPFSLFKIFGPTSKGPGETRAVLNRAKILELLAGEECLRRTDIATKLGLARGLVGSHLRSLANLGLVEYSFANLEEAGWAKYQLLKNAQRRKVRTVRSYPRLTTEVANLLFELKTVDANLLAEKLKETYPKGSLKNLRGDISRVLSDLVRRGVCRAKLYIGAKIHSQANITEAGREIVSEINWPIKRALAGNGDLLSQARSIPWQDYTKDAISKYQEASGNANRRSAEETAGKILSIIVKNPGIRPKEIKLLLGRKPEDPLKILLASGLVRKQRQGISVCYFPVEVS